MQSCTQWRGNVCSSRCAWRPTEIEREPKGIHNSEWYDIKTKLTPRIQRKYGLFSARHIACVFFVGPPRAFRAVRLLTFLVLTTTRTRTRGLHFKKDRTTEQTFHVFISRLHRRVIIKDNRQRRNRPAQSHTLLSSREPAGSLHATPYPHRGGLAQLGPPARLSFTGRCLHSRCPCLYEVVLSSIVYV